MGDRGVIARDSSKPDLRLTASWRRKGWRVLAGAGGCWRWSAKYVFSLGKVCSEQPTFGRAGFLKASGG
jgi:hypothetical protein